jgi:hypothetical protein
VNAIVASDMLLIMIGALCSGFVEGETTKGECKGARELGRENGEQHRICLYVARLLHGGCVFPCYAYIKRGEHKMEVAARQVARIYQK